MTTKTSLPKQERRSALKRALAEPGRPLPEGLREVLEFKFGADFRRVRVHTGPAADEVTRDLNAEAVTFGQHILFRLGAWHPETPSGLDLVQHEASHTLQMTGPLPDAATARVSEPGDATERGADAAVKESAAPAPLAEAVLARRVAGIPRRTAEPRDPARTASEIARTLIERVRGDAHDRNGRVRNQLIRMEDNLKRDVLRWMEAHMESHEWHTFVDLLAEPVPSGIEGAEDSQATASAPAEEAAPTGEQAPAADQKPAVAEGTLEATPEQAAGEPQTGDAEQTPAEAEVAKPAIQGDETPAPTATAGGGGVAPPAQESRAGAVPVPSAPAPPAETPAVAPTASAPPEHEEHTEQQEEPQGDTAPHSEAAAPEHEAMSHEDESHETDAREEASTEHTESPAEVEPPQQMEAPVASEATPVAATPEPAPEPEPPAPAETAEPEPEHSDVPEASHEPEVAPHVEEEAGPSSAETQAPEQGHPGAAAPAGPPPPALLGEFSGEPSEAEGPAPSGGGGGGGAAAAPAPEQPEAPAVVPENPVAAMQSVGTMRVAQASQAMGAAAESVSAQTTQQRGDLEAQPPTIERPTGSPQGAEGSTPGKVPSTPPGPDPSHPAATPVGAAVPLPAPGQAPQPGVPVTQHVAPPQVTGTAEGKVTQADAQRVEQAVDNVPVADEALNVTAGDAPALPLEGDADPAHSADQQNALMESADAAQTQGAEEAAAPMGEGHIYPATQPGTIRPENTDCSCDGGQAAQRQTGGPPNAGVAAVAEQEKGDQVRQSASDAAGQLTQKQQEQSTEQQRANQDSQREVEQSIDDNAKQQSTERRRARREVQQSRDQWTEGQRSAVTTARGDSTAAVSDAQDKVSAEQTRAQDEANGHIEDANRDIERTRNESEQKARDERERSKREADGGILGWLASSITSFFNRLRDAIHAVFDLARRAVKAVIETAQKLAHAVIDLARRAVVGLIRAAAVLLTAIADTLLAAFPTLRARFRAAIAAVVDAAVAAVNKLADLLERGIKALLNALMAALNAILCLYERIYMAIVDAVANAVKGALDFARAVIAAFGMFAALVVDIAANPGQWLRNLGSSIMDGLRNHLWTALKTAVKAWFNETIEGIIGMGRMLLDILRKGGISLRKIAGFVWQALLSALPGIIVQFLIEKLISLLIPAASAIILIIQGLIAAWGAVQRVIQAFQLFFVFLKAVKSGNAGPQFATALAASAVAVIQFLAMFLISRLGRAASGVASKLKALATRLIAFFRRAARAVGRVLRRAGRVILRGVRAVGRLAGRGARALGRVLRRTRVGRAILRGVRRVRVGIARLRQRFRKWRERRRQRRADRRAEYMARAQRELPSKIEGLLRQKPSGIRLRAQLFAWKLMYRLRRLRVGGAGDSYPIVAANSPEVVLVNGYKYPMHEIMRAIDEVTEQFMAQHSGYRGRGSGDTVHVGETGGTSARRGDEFERPIGYSLGQIRQYGSPLQEVRGMGRRDPLEVLQARQALIARGGVPRTGRMYRQLSGMLEGVPVGEYFGGMISGYRQHRPLPHAQREAVGSLFGLWFDFEPGHPRVRPAPGQLGVPTMAHKRDLTYSHMLTDLMQREKGAGGITPQRAIEMHPASFGGAQRGARQATAAMHEGAIDTAGRSQSFKERIRRERTTLEAWFRANPVNCEGQPSYQEIKDHVFNRMTQMLRANREDVA